MLQTAGGIASILGLVLMIGQVVYVAINRQRFARILKTWFFMLSIVLLVSGVGVEAYFRVTAATKPPPVATDSSRYNFETGLQGWIARSSGGDTGVTEVAQSQEVDARAGSHSLRLSVDLNGGEANKKAGEAYVEIQKQDLENRPITVWFFLPEDKICGGHSHRNGIQVFVKDAQWRSQYDTWLNIEPWMVGQWTDITMTPSKTKPPDGFMDEGFDPKNIKEMGLKVAINADPAAAGQTYEGPIYIDTVDWPK